MHPCTENFVVISLGTFWVWLLRIQWRHMKEDPE